MSNLNPDVPGTETSALPNLQNLNIFLVGMMGCGKTTIGQTLARALQYQFMDTDGLIVQIAQQSVNQIFATQGEPYFRDLETQILNELAAHTRLVIGTGGGIVLKQANWGHLRQGVVIWLDIPLEDLWQRVRNDTSRPLLKSRNPYETLRKVLHDRYPLYQQADLQITPPAEATPQEVVTQILTALPTILRSQPSETPAPSFN
jgi:shikimate kinase